MRKAAAILIFVFQAGLLSAQLLPEQRILDFQNLAALYAKRPRAEFLAGMAQELFDRTDLFGSTKLDLPNRTKMMCQEAIEALQAGQATKDSKALKTKIEAALKKIKAT